LVKQCTSHTHKALFIIKMGHSMLLMDQVNILTKMVVTYMVGILKPKMEQNIMQYLAQVQLFMMLMEMPTQI